MRPHRIVNKKDIAVLSAVALLLWVNLAAVGSGGRQRAKELVCRSNLRQWGWVFEAFARDHDGYSLSGEGQSMGQWWIKTLWPYHKEAKLMLCPAATQSLGNGVAYCHHEMAVFLVSPAVS